MFVVNKWLRLTKLQTFNVKKKLVLVNFIPMLELKDENSHYFILSLLFHYFSTDFGLKQETCKTDHYTKKI